MKRLFFAAAVVFAIAQGSVPTIARAEMPPGEHKDGGLGFHSVEAPIGLRWWLSSQKVGIDLGLGYHNEPALPGYPDETISGWAIEAGVPFVIHSWSRAHVLLRPGLLYQSQEFVASTPPAPLVTSDGTTFDLVGELEAEVFLVDNISVSASHGIRYSTFNPPGPGGSESTFGTFGNNFTNVGFHVYFLGGSER